MCLLAIRIYHATLTVPLIRDGKRKVHTCVLTLLFSMVIVNLGTTWRCLRDIMLAHNDTRDAMILELLKGPLGMAHAVNAAGCIAVLIADTLLVRMTLFRWHQPATILISVGMAMLHPVEAQ